MGGGVRVTVVACACASTHLRRGFFSFATQVVGVDEAAAEKGTRAPPLTTPAPIQGTEAWQTRLALLCMGFGAPGGCPGRPSFYPPWG